MRGAVIPLGRLGVTPNMLTVLGFIISVLTAYLFTLSSENKEFLIYCGSLILLSGFVDAIDGILARSINRVTSFGGYFDSVTDRYSDAVIYTGIIAAGLCNQIIGLIALFGSLLVSYTRARAETEGVKMAGIGLGERAERMILLSLCSIVAYWWQQALDYGVFILAIIAHITVIQRTMYFKKEIERSQSNF